MAIHRAIWHAALVALLVVGLSLRAEADDLGSRPPGAIVAALAAAVISGDDRPVRSWLTPAGQQDLKQIVRMEADDHGLGRLGPTRPATVVARQERVGGTLLTLQTAAPGGSARWDLFFADGPGLIDTVDLAVTSAAVTPPRPRVATRSVHHAMRRGFGHTAGGAVEGDTEVIAAPAPVPGAPSSPAVPPPAADASVGDPRAVEFLLATTRKVQPGSPPAFTAERGDGLTLGIVRVHVPLDHAVGQVERPVGFHLAGFTLYEEKLDAKKHFVVSGVRMIGQDDFDRFATGDPTKTALIFVHGFNNTFEDSAYRFAQILYDLHYDRPAILFSWASKGSVADYLYDHDSAEIARGRFADLVRRLRQRGVDHIQVIAHSMGNYLAVAALADSVGSTDPEHLDQVVMAAPDMPRDYFATEAAKLRTIARGMTLYACSTDRALEVSKSVAGGIPRAGDVPAGGPVLLEGLTTIDVSALGTDWFGLNHDVFATNRTVMADIRALLASGRHPYEQLRMQGMPAGATPPSFWRFVAP